MPNELQPKSMHQYGLMLEKRNLRIRELEAEVARLKQGGQPASQLRDLLLPGLRMIRDNVSVGKPEGLRDLRAMIRHLDNDVPGSVAKEPAPAKDNSYKSLDHGKPDR